jgi:hypothetical protein
MMERKMVLMAVVLLVSLCGAVVQAIYIPTSFGDGADSYVSNNPAGKGVSTLNYGAAGNLKDRFNGGNSRDFVTYLRFDLTGLAEDFVFAADTKLQLTTSWMRAGSLSQTSRAMYIYGLVNDDDDNWVEGSGLGTAVAGITYANAPGMLTPDTIGENGATVVGNDQGNYKTDNTKLILLGKIWTYVNPTLLANSDAHNFWSAISPDLVAFLQAGMGGNGLVTLVLLEKDGTAASNNEEEFGTKEQAGRAPALVPEPATMLIFGLGSLLLARTKRR